MKIPYRTLGKIAIGTFCVWHMFAVLAFTLPGNLSNTVNTTLESYGLNEDRANILEILRWKVAGPYLISLSQWQQWNMFSPNPSRIVVTMQVEKKVTDAMWQSIRVVDPEHLSWWQRSREIKMLYSLGLDSGKAPLERFILPSECRLFGLPEGTQLRLILTRYLLPKGDAPRDKEFWKMFTPNSVHSIRDQYTCPAL